MTLTRPLILAALMIAASCGSVCAQRRERLPTLRDPQFYAPRNQLEDFDGRMETILIKGRSWVGTVRAQNGTARVEATEIRDTATSKRAAGVVVTVMADSGPPGEIRSLIRDQPPATAGGSDSLTLVQPLFRLNHHPT